jgi:two-component system, LytTR family, response regulator
MRAIIIDDELSNRQNLIFLLGKVAGDVEVVTDCGTVKEGLSAIKKYLPDLVFLDIQLHNESGFELLKQLNDITFEIIFITAYDKYGIQAVKFAALDYILKPVDVSELEVAVSKARNKINDKEKNKRLEYLIDLVGNNKNLPRKIALPMFNEIRYVTINDIVRCEAENTYTNFHLISGEKLLISKPLKEYTDLLTDYGFLRSHQSHLVNMKYINSWLKEDGGFLLLQNQTRVPVSRLNREKVKAALAQHLR